MVTYADKPWLARYDDGVPKSLHPYPDIPFHAYLRKNANDTPDNVALISSARVPLLGRISSNLTYGQLDKLSDELAAALVQLGLKKGDRVALIMPNVAAFVISFYGVLKAGGVVAATNPTYPPKRLQHQINDCGAEIVITLSLFYDTIKQVQSETNATTIIVTNVKEYLPRTAQMLFTLVREKKDGHRVVLQAGDHWLQDLLKQYSEYKPAVEVNRDDLAIFQYTGGTTGISKGVKATHGALVANTLQSQAWTSSVYDDAKRRNAIYLGAIPMFHAFGMIIVLGQAISTGSKIVLVPNARDLDDMLDVIASFKPTVMMGVPALYNAINNHPHVRSGKVSLQSIELCGSGAAPLPPATKREFEKLSGATLTEGYGLSEIPTGTHANPFKGENRVGSIGLPYPDMEIRIVSLEDGVTEMPVGESGELVMHGPQLMLGYHNMPTETASTLREFDGKTWLYTGDVARMDEDGYFYLVDRKKDMALIGGFNVYPTTIEKVLSDHPAVLEVCVAGIPHPEKPGQEALKAWIVLKRGQSVTIPKLIEHCSSYLVRYEVPTRYSFVDALPKTAVGKTLRRELVKMEQESQSAEAI